MLGVRGGAAGLGATGGFAGAGVVAGGGRETAFVGRGLDEGVCELGAFVSGAEESGEPSAFEAGVEGFALAGADGGTAMGFSLEPSDSFGSERGLSGDGFDVASASGAAGVATSSSWGWTGELLAPNAKIPAATRPVSASASPA